jgi:hypothetical protein
MTTKELQAAIDKLELHEGDIILVDRTQIEPGAFLRIKGPWHNFVLFVNPPSEGQSLRDCINTIDLEYLKKVVAKMEAR